MLFLYGSMHLKNYIEEYLNGYLNDIDRLKVLLLWWFLNPKAIYHTGLYCPIKPNNFRISPLLHPSAICCLADGEASEDVRPMWPRMGSADPNMGRGIVWIPSSSCCFIIFFENILRLSIWKTYSDSLCFLNTTIYNPDYLRFSLLQGWIKPQNP